MNNCWVDDGCDCVVGSWGCGGCIVGSGGYINGVGIEPGIGEIIIFNFTFFYGIVFVVFVIRFCGL